MASITQRKKIIYKCNKYLLCILIIMLAATLTIMDKSTSYVRLIFIASSTLLLIRWITAPFLKAYIDKEIYEKFKVLIHTKKYFSSPGWIKAYGEYCVKHSPRTISAIGLKTDLASKYILRIIKRDWPIPVFFIPLFAAFPAMRYSSETGPWLVMTGIVEAVYFSVLLIVSAGPYRRWLDNVEKCGYHCDEINNSYLSGQAFEYSYNTLVIGKKFLHTFDGHDFHTVEKNNIREIQLGVERITVDRTIGRARYYSRDEYRFRITFFHEGGYRDFDFSLVLNQFQIKQIIDKFFQDTPIRDEIECRESKCYSMFIAPLCDVDSYPVIDDTGNDRTREL